MKTYLHILLVLIATAAFAAAPFTPLQPDEGYGVPSTAWRFASSLSKDATGVIEICYGEEGSTERVLGTVDVRPFLSSESKSPDLRILFTRTTLEGKEMVVLLVGYGIRAGVFVVDVPGLTSHSLAVAGTPLAGASGEFTLLGFGDGPVAIKRDGMTGVRGRLFFRYIEKS
jgi:hypothetical protein